MRLRRNCNLDDVKDIPLSESDVTATARWFGRPTEMKLAPRIIDGSYLIIEFAPVELASTYHFVVGEPQNEFFSYFFEDIRPFLVENEWPLTVAAWLDTALRNIEAGFWGRVIKFADAELQFGRTGFEFLGASGVVGHYTTATVMGGSRARMRNFGTDDYNPECAALRWFDGASSEAASFLAGPDDDELQEWLIHEAKRAGSALGFSRNWRDVPGAERRTWLPVVTKDRSKELLQVVGWALTSGPTLPEESPSQMWSRPRFTIGRDGLSGNPHSYDESPSEKRLQVLWPFIWNALKDYEEPDLARRIPGVAAWVQSRYTLKVVVEPPSQHERLEAFASLKQWLQANAPEQREQWEPLLQES